MRIDKNKTERRNVLKATGKTMSVPILAGASLAQTASASDGTTSIRETSSWYEPYNVLEIKLDSDLSETLEYYAREQRNYSAFVGVLSGLAGQTYITAIAAYFALNGATMANRLDYNNDGCGVEITLYHRSFPIASNCGVLVPGGSCQDLPATLDDAMAFYYREDVSSQSCGDDDDDDDDGGWFPF